jgi:hypothetical protein
MDKIFKSLEELNTVEDINAQLETCEGEKENLRCRLRKIGDYVDELYKKKKILNEQAKFTEASQKVGKYFKYEEEDFKACLYVVRCEELETEPNDEESYSQKVICNVVWNGGTKYGSYYGNDMDFYDGEFGGFDYTLNFVDFSVMEECTKEEFTKLKKQLDSKEN